jgi:hypothetical protein
MLLNKASSVNLFASSRVNSTMMVERVGAINTPISQGGLDIPATFSRLQIMISIGFGGRP